MAPRSHLLAWAIGLTCWLTGLGCYHDRRARCDVSEDCAAGHRCGTAKRCTPRSHAGQRCRSHEDCAAELVCTIDGVCRERDVDWCRPSADCADYHNCPNRGCWRVAAAGDGCRDTEDCDRHGRCSLQDGRCVPGSAADCSNSQHCRVRGLCSLRGGECVAASNEDCRRTGACRMHGRCQAVRGECVVASDEGCRRNPLCKEQGRCQFVDGACRMSRDADCRGFKDCADCGHCRAVGGRCVASSEADCRAAHQCWNFGQCTLSGDRCVATSDADCAACWECKVWGHCALDGEFCMPDADGCRRSWQCTDDGLCAVRDGACVAVSNADCGRSKACHEHGRCQAEGGRCVLPEDQRVAAGMTTDAQCRASTECAKHGRCRATRGICVVGSDRDCRQSAACDFVRACTAVHAGEARGRCISPSKRDAAPRVLGVGAPPIRGSRTHHCDEPRPQPAPATMSFTAAPQVRAKRVGRDVVLEPIGQRVRVPDHWYPLGGRRPFIVVGEDLARLQPALYEGLHEERYPLTTVLLEAHLPHDGLLSFMMARDFDPRLGWAEGSWHSFNGPTVAVLALQQSVAKVVAELERALAHHAHVAHCLREPEPPGNITKGNLLPWPQWRSLAGSWQRVGAEATWVYYGHGRKNWVELNVRRFDDATIVVMFSYTADTRPDTDLHRLLPVPDRGAPSDEPVRVGSESRCILPPKGNIHWALRSSP